MQCITRALKKRVYKVLHRNIAWLIVVVAACAQLMLLLDLISSDSVIVSAKLWLTLHTGCAVLAAIAASVILVPDPQTVLHASPPVGSAIPLALLVLPINLLIPFVGTLGIVVTLAYARHAAGHRLQQPHYWQLTQLAQLPFTTPIDRELTAIDSRGFTEHLMYSRDDRDLYRKVLAAGSIKNTLSVSALKQAMRHSDDRIRLTAYKTLDKKVTQLNRDIQYLESRVELGDNQESSNSWLQIASNYWELLTLEKDEPVARQQLLEKASAAAIQAVAVLPVNRNAHFILGRVSLLQGNGRRAKIAFERASALGMPDDKVLPYLAEVEFKAHNFSRVHALMNKLDPAITAYPPLSHVADYWA